MYHTIRATALSIKPKKWAKASNADKLEAFVREAAREQPDLIVAPEGCLEGYVVNEVIEDRSKEPALLEIAEPLDGPYIQRFQGLARELSLCLCFGFAERVGEEVYNAAVFLGRSGDICGTYHKTQLAEGTHPSWRFNCIGKKLRAFDTPIGRMGILICNDRWNPMLGRALVLDGARALLIPSYGSRRKAQNDAVVARARENGVPVVEANVGVNLIVSKGEVVAYAWGADRISTAEIDLPVPPSTRAARSLERQYLELQGPEMAQRYARTVDRLRGAAAD